MGKNGIKTTMIPPQIIPQISQGVTLDSDSFMQDISCFS
jgi:hypothetical protein